MVKNPELAAQMRAIRVVNKYTQQQIADILNIDRTTYTSYEISKNTPDIMLLDAFAKIFSVDVDFILHIDALRSETLRDEMEAYAAEQETHSLVSKLTREERELLAEYRILDEAGQQKVRKTIAACNLLKKAK